MFPGPLGFSVLGNGLKNGLWQCKTANIRDYADDKHRTVDDEPYGGGPGMVMKAPVIDRAICANHNPQHQLIMLSPCGVPLNTKLAKDLAKLSGITLICGRFEAIDERIIAKHQPLEISIGDYILTGGEVAAMVLCETILRFIPKMLGKEESLENESHSGFGLEYPQYTRPEIWENYEVPKILLTGHHKKIKEWREVRAKIRTETRRPDLVKGI